MYENLWRQIVTAASPKKPSVLPSFTPDHEYTYVQLLCTLIECLQYLARQGQAMQGDTDDESNFIQLLKLRGKDQSLLLKWLERKEDRYTSHDIQNEIIANMANHVIRDLVSKIRGGFFSIICNEYTDISNKEQLTICIRWLDKELEAHEDFLGFYNVPDIGAETIVSAIKDVLL